MRRRRGPDEAPVQRPSDYRYNQNCRVVDYCRDVERNQLYYKVDQRGEGTSLVSSQSARQLCPVNLIHFLESRLHLRKSLPFETVVKYAEHLEKF